MITLNKLSFVLIGGTTLLVRCAEYLTSRGHLVEAVVSDDRDLVHNWMLHESLGAAMEVMLEPPDYLISIVNSRILSNSELDWPKVAAINYHDSPLPSYAGVNAVSWAILMGEPTHGITWHRMTRKVDAGNIMVQRHFPISDADTALSLSANCYEQALDAFGELVEKIERGDSAGTPQKSQRGSIFKREMRLPRQGIIDWSEDATAICRYVRAGHLGPYPNDFGLPKILLPNGKLIAVGCAKTDLTTTAEPVGTILESRREFVRVAVGGGHVVELSGLCMLDGRVFDGSLLDCETRLPLLSESEIRDIDAATRTSAKLEDRLRASLLDLPHPLLPEGLRPFKYPEAGRSEHVFERRIGSTGSAGSVFAQVVEGLLSGGGQQPVIIGIGSSPIHGFKAWKPMICSRFTNSRLVAEIDQSFAEPPIPADLTTRFPSLLAARLRIESLAVCLSTNNSGSTDNPGIIAVFERGTLILRFASSQISQADATRMAAMIFGNRAPLRLPLPIGWLPVQTRILSWSISTPDAVAVESDSGVLYYGELDRRASILAARLCARGAGRERIVATLLPRGTDFIISILAALKCGAAYLPLEISNPSNRLQEIVRDSRPVALVSNSEGLPQANHLGVPVILVDENDDTVACPPTSASEPDDLAYVIYTSGSSGAPKGSMIEHGALAHFIEADIASNKISPGDRILQLCSVSFDASVEEIFSSLCSGATLVIRPDGILDSAHGYLDFCEDAKLTIIGIFSSLLADVLSAIEQRGRFPRSVRLVTTGGESVNVADVNRWRNFFRESGTRPPRFLNVYGLTETTVANCVFDLSMPVEITKSVPIGRPLPGNLVRVVDADFRSVATGESGELLIAGPQLARAYWNRPELNASRFIYQKDDGMRWFRTGDLVRRLPSGDLDLEGRIDMQIKIRGNRVELGEVEKVLRSHPHIRDCVVVVRENSLGEHELIGFTTLAGEGRFSPDDMREFARQRLPSYMIPSRFHRLGSIPLNTSGKVDRKALETMDLLEMDSSSEFEAPYTGLHSALVEIWKAVLRRERVGIHDNFFDLGGHSLQAARLVAEIEKQLGQRHSIASLFQSPTVASFARRLTDNEWVPAWNSLVPLQANGSKPPIFFIHGIGGDVYVFLELARLLGNDQPSYGMQSLSGSGKSELHAGLSEMAASYAREIISFYPSGPYRLVGYSLGGIIAYEVAQELRRRGHEVELLALLDTEPYKVSIWEFCGMFVPERCLYHILEWAKMPMSEKLEYARKRWIAFRHRLAWNLRHQAAASAPDPAMESSSAPQQGLLEAPLAFATSHIMKRYPGRLDFFKADDGNTRWCWYWSYLAMSGVVMHRIRGNHGQILEKEYVPSLARALASRLELGGIS